MFLKNIFKMFFVCFFTFQFFLLFMSRFLFLLKILTYKITNMIFFLMGKSRSAVFDLYRVRQKSSPLKCFCRFLSNRLEF